MPASKKYVVKFDGAERNGLAAWNAQSKQFDQQSIEVTSDYGLTPPKSSASFDLRPLKIRKFILSKIIVRYAGASKTAATSRGAVA